MSYISEVIAATERKNPNEPEFLQTVKEVFESLAPVIAKNEALYRKNCILERMVEPDRAISFRVPWMDDRGNWHVNRGYRVPFCVSLLLICFTFFFIIFITFYIIIFTKKPFRNFFIKNFILFNIKYFFI